MTWWFLSLSDQPLCGAQAGMCRPLGPRQAGLAHPGPAVCVCSVVGGSISGLLPSLCAQPAPPTSHPSCRLAGGADFSATAHPGVSVCTCLLVSPPNEGPSGTHRTASPTTQHTQAPEAPHGPDSGPACPEVPWGPSVGRPPFTCLCTAGGWSRAPQGLREGRGFSSFLNLAKQMGPFPSEGMGADLWVVSHGPSFCLLQEPIELPDVPSEPLPEKNPGTPRSVLWETASSRTKQTPWPQGPAHTLAQWVSCWPARGEGRGAPSPTLGWVTSEELASVGRGVACRWEPRKSRVGHADSWASVFAGPGLG